MGFADTIVALCIGLGLSAACGFRVFVPMLVMGAAGRSGLLDLAAGFDWLSTWPALVAFATASVLEVGASCIPWVDHAVDVAAAPAALIAGTIATAAQLDGAGSLAGWATGLLAGGAAAGATHMVNAATRAVSTIGTGGAGNPVLSLMQAAAAFLVSMLTILAPVVAVAVLIFAAVWLYRRLRGGRGVPAAATLNLSA